VRDAKVGRRRRGESIVRSATATATAEHGQRVPARQHDTRRPRGCSSIEWSALEWEDCQQKKGATVRPRRGWHERRSSCAPLWHSGLMILQQSGDNQTHGGGQRGELEQPRLVPPSANEGWAKQGRQARWLDSSLLGDGCRRRRHGLNTDSRPRRATAAGSANGLRT